MNSEKIDEKKEWYSGQASSLNKAIIAAEILVTNGIINPNSTIKEYARAICEIKDVFFENTRFNKNKK